MRHYHLGQEDSQALRMSLQTKVELNTFAFNAISACDKAGTGETALHLISVAKRRLVESSTFTLNDECSSSEKHGHWGRALHLFKVAVHSPIELLLVLQ